MLKVSNAESSKRDCFGNVHEEYQYLRLINDILDEGSMEVGRNGKAKTVFGAAMHFDLSNNTIPVLTTKKVAFKTCLKELLWFINGYTDNKLLKEQKVKIWNANASREFLDSRGLHNNKEDDLGPVYGHQWRHFNANYTDCDTDYTGKGVDQLQNIIDQLKNPETRNSRRLVMSAWNPQQLDEMALPPCHILFQWYLDSKKRLWIQLYQRSGDMFLGVPFNMFSYAVLLNLMCKKTDYKPGGIVHVIGDAHIYENHIDAVEKQLSRNPKEYPKLIINSKKEWKDYTIDDFEINDYDPHEKIFAPMSA